MTEVPVETITSHCYKWDIHENPRKRGEEEGDDADENVQIRAWCLDRKVEGHDSQPYLLRFENFPAFCHVELPKYVDGRPKVWDRASIDAFIRWLTFVLAEDRPVRAMYKEVPKIYFYRGTQTKFPMLMLAFKTIRAMTHCEKLLAKPHRLNDIGLVKCNVWETSISIVRKLLTTKHCGFSQWFSIEGQKVDEDFAISTLEREYTVDWTSMRALEATETKGWVSNPRILAFDIETYSNNHRAFPNQYHALHVAYMISCIFQRVGDKASRKRYAIILGDCDEMIDPDGSIFAEVFRVKTEIELVAVYARLIRELDPEIISGYNILGFDYPYLDARIKRRGCDWPQMGRLKDVMPTFTTKVWKSSAYGYNKINILHMDGRISIDMLPLVKRDHKLDKYDLDFVSKNFLGEENGKHDIKAREMFVIFEKLRNTTADLAAATGAYSKITEELILKRGTNEDYEPDDIRRKDAVEATMNEKQTAFVAARANITRVMKYCIQDSELVIDLFEKLNIWIALVELSNIVGVSIMELFTSGQQIRCISQMYNLAANLGFVMDKRDMAKVHFSGGFVYEPIPGLYDNVICLDFASLYPSIMMAYNICHSTLVPPELEDQIADEDCNVIEFDQEEEEEEEHDEDDGGDKDKAEKKKKKGPIVIKHYRYKFIKAAIREGILPQLVRKLVVERRALRNQLDGVKNQETGEWIIKPEEEPTTRVVLDKRQLALKVSANSMFGFLGAQSGKLPLIEGARCITAIGRMLIGKVNAYLKEKYNARIVYGDTDSCMIDLGITDARDANRWGVRLSQEISGITKGQKMWDGTIAENDVPGLFPPPLAMEFEKAMRLLCLKKKKYASFFVLKDGTFKRDKKTGEIEILKRGIVLARRDNCKYLRRIYNEVLLKILHKRPIEEAMDIIIDSIDTLLKGQVDNKELIVIREIGNYGPESTYFMKTFGDELRKLGKPVQPGDRIEYLVCNVPGAEKVGLKMRSIETFTENIDAGKPETVDYNYYVEKQLMNPIDQLVSIGFANDFRTIENYFGEGKIGYKPQSRKKFTGISNPIKMIVKMLGDGQSVEAVKPWFRSVMSMARPKAFNLRIVE